MAGIDANQINAFKFTGGGTPYLQIPAIAGFTRTGTWTFSAWFRMVGDPGSSTHMICEYSPGATDRMQIKLLTGGSNGRIAFGDYNGSYSGVISDRAKLNDGAWHHVACTMSAGTKTIYIDGRPGQSSTSIGAMSNGAQNIGWQVSGSSGARHSQTDTRLYLRVMDQREVMALFLTGPDDSRTSPFDPSDYEARWHPRYIDTSSVEDLSGNGHHLTWSTTPDRTQFIKDYPETLPVGLQTLYAVGNSHTLDAHPGGILNNGAYYVNSGQFMSYHVANPNSSTEVGSYLWGTALEIEAYDVLMLQMYPEDPIQLITTEVGYMQTFIDKQPGAIILLHESYAPSATVEAGTLIDTADDGYVRWSRACHEEMVRQLQDANPGRTVVRSRTNDAVFLIGEDLAAGADMPFTEIGGSFGSTALYRDGQHVQWTWGRYLIHNCMRRALGLQPRCGEEFTNHPNYSDMDGETQLYLDSVIERVFESDRGAYKGIPTWYPLMRAAAADGVTNVLEDPVDANVITAAGLTVSPGKINLYLSAGGRIVNDVLQIVPGDEYKISDDTSIILIDGNLPDLDAFDSAELTIKVQDVDAAVIDHISTTTLTESTKTVEFDMTAAQSVLLAGYVGEDATFDIEGVRADATRKTLARGAVEILDPN